MAMSLIASTGGLALMADFVRNFLTWSVISRPLAGEAPSIDLVLDYHRANISPLYVFSLKGRPTGRADIETVRRIGRILGGRRAQRALKSLLSSRTEPIPLRRWRSAMGQQRPKPWHGTSDPFGSRNIPPLGTPPLALPIKGFLIGNRHFDPHPISGLC
jgi:hypothetical protein